MWTDANGTSWKTAVTVSTIKRVKEITDVLLTDAADGGDIILKLNSDVIYLANVLYAVCEPQAKERELSDIEFGELLFGEVIEKAYDSLMDDLLLFFQPGRKERFQSLLTATKRLEKEQTAIIEAKISPEQMEKIIKRESARILKQIDQHLDGLGKESGKSLES